MKGCCPRQISPLTSERLKLVVLLYSDYMVCKPFLQAPGAFVHYTGFRRGESWTNFVERTEEVTWKFEIINVCDNLSGEKLKFNSRETAKLRHWRKRMRRVMLREKNDDKMREGMGTCSCNLATERDLNKQEMTSAKCLCLYFPLNITVENKHS